MVIEIGSSRYFRTIEDERGQFRWIVVRMAAGVSAGVGTPLDQGVEATREAAECEGDAALMRVVDAVRAKEKKKPGT